MPWGNGGGQLPHPCARVIISHDLEGDHHIFVRSTSRLKGRGSVYLSFSRISRLANAAPSGLHFFRRRKVLSVPEGKTKYHIFRHGRVRRLPKLTYLGRSKLGLGRVGHFFRLIHRNGSALHRHCHVLRRKRRTVGAHVQRLGCSGVGVRCVSRYYRTCSGNRPLPRIGPR